MMGLGFQLLLLSWVQRRYSTVVPVFCTSINHDDLLTEGNTSSSKTYTVVLVVAVVMPNIYCSEMMPEDNHS